MKLNVKLQELTIGGGEKLELGDSKVCVHNLFLLLKSDDSMHLCNLLT